MCILNVDPIWIWIIKIHKNKSEFLRKITHENDSHNILFVVVSCIIITSRAQVNTCCNFNSLQDIMDVEIKNVIWIIGITFDIIKM